MIVFSLDGTARLPLEGSGREHALFWQDDGRVTDSSSQPPAAWAESCATPVQAINMVLSHALRQKEDVLIVGQGCRVTEKALRVLHAFDDDETCDPMIMFAAPRDASGKITGLPLACAGKDAEPCRQGGDALLPEVTYVPRLYPSCVLVKTAFLSEIGFLDEAFSAWPEAMDDLSLRANACGFRAVLLNHAFVQAGTYEAAEADEALLAQHHPEAGALVEEYLASARRRAERLVCMLTAPRRLVAFDFSYFSTGHDGTNEAGISLLRAAASVWKDHDIAVIASEEVWSAHHLETIPGVVRLEPGRAEARAFAVIRMGQPWRGHELPPIFHCAPVVAFFMLDAIGYDCLYNAAQVPGLDDVWAFVAEFSDCIFTQSHFTLKRFQERFPVSAACRCVVSYHSLDVSDYGQAAQGVQPEHILVMGNHFKHKFVTPTADRLAEAFPEEKFAAVGYTKEPALPNIERITSGNIEGRSFFALYDKARCVIFPSVYEGFGFPVLHALARQKVVYVRKSSLYDELKAHVSYASNIRQYRDTDELVRRLSQPDAFDFSCADPASDEKSGRDRKGWERSARELLAALEHCAQDAAYDRILSRIRWCRAWDKAGQES